MASVAFLKGINVGGHRRFRPAVLADELGRLTVVNIGSTGTFVVRKRINWRDLRAEIASRVPFLVEIMICDEHEIRRLVAQAPFAGHVAGRDIVPFVGVMVRRTRIPLTFPLAFPAEDDWYVKALGSHGRFVLGLYRRRMKTIGCFGQLEKWIRASLAIRSWNTILAVEKALAAQASG